MTAEPPRMDTSELLLSKFFLDNCSDKYAVMPRLQESQAQPFVSKHFNVIDPLRTNNNLGRSVSKGNFFRIRSAFSFGAKRLVKLLECPKEDLFAEVNQFFTNTWIRHGSVCRPDVPMASLVNEHPLKVVLAEASNIQRSAATPKKFENSKLRFNQGYLAEGAHNYHEHTSQPPHKSDPHSQNSPRKVNSVVSHTQHKKIYAAQVNTKGSEQLERNRSGGSTQSEKDKKMTNALFVNDRHGENRSRFARTRSSPELTDPSVEGYSRGRRTRVVETERNLKVDYNNRRNNLAPEVSSNHSAKSSQDESMSSMNSSSHPSAKAASDSNSISSSYREDTGFMINEELPSVSEAEALEMQHQDHVLVNLMESANLHGFNGQVQMPLQIPSHMSVASSHSLAPTGFPHKHLARIPPTSLTGASWSPNFQFIHGFVPPHMTRYVHNPTFRPNIDDDGIESEKPITSNANHDDGNNWHEYGVGLSRHLSHDGRDPHMHHFDGKDQISSPNSISGVPLERQSEFNIEDNGVLEEHYANLFQNQTSIDISTNVSRNSGNVRNSSSQTNSPRSRALSENSWDEIGGQASGSVRDKWGKRPAFAAPMTTIHSKSESGWQTGQSSEYFSTGVDDSGRNVDMIPVIRYEASDTVKGSGSSSTPSRTSQLPNDIDASHLGMPNPMFAPIFIGSAQQRQADSSGPFFVPTGGPLVPYVMFQYVPGNNDGSVPQFDRNEGIDQLHANMDIQNTGSLSDVPQPDTNAISAASFSTVADLSDEHKPDILNSDFLSHWHNLQYGRFCQHARPMAPVLYHLPVPPMYLQGHVPWDGSGRPASPNVNWAPMVGHGQHGFPAMPLQPASERATSVPQHYAEDVPRYRGGTGTYLPTPKAPFRDRHSSSRNYRGSYNGDKGDHNDKEGSWINSKQRNPSRSYGRSQSERSGMRSDRQTTDESHFDRHRRSYRNDLYRHEGGAQYFVQGQSFGSTNSIRRQGNMSHGVYSSPSTASNGVGALSGSSARPYFMLHPFEADGNRDSPSEPLEFGSLGPVPTADGDDIPQSTRQVIANGLYGQRHAAFRGGSSHSSPDQPSSPKPRR